MTLFQNKYRIESARLKGWDYKNPWWYFVTINTKDHIPWFGKVVKGKMKLNQLGKIVEKNWNEIIIHYKNTELDYVVVMPNHIHCIVILNPNVEPGHVPAIHHSLSNIVGSFKSAVTKYAHENGKTEFAWQPRFYDRIIRNEKELYKIRRYIDLNPLRWELEKEQPENIDI
jgi:putative transposase